MAGIPLAIELVSLGVEWFAKIFQITSIAMGAYKIAQASGWLKESKSKKEEREKQRRMEHYFYHYERNPKAFERLKTENFQREAERTRKEAATLAGDRSQQ